MRKLIVSLAALGLGLASTGAIAATADFPAADTDNSGYVSWAELTALFPDLTEAEFQAADADGDGELSVDEFSALTISTGAVGTKPVTPRLDQPVPESLSVNIPGNH